MPSQPYPDPPANNNRRRSDELIAVLIAFLSLGGIFVWAISQKDFEFDLASLMQSSQSQIAAVPSLEPTSPAQESASRRAASTQKPATSTESAPVAWSAPPESVSASSLTTPVAAPTPQSPPTEATPSPIAPEPAPETQSKEAKPASEKPSGVKPSTAVSPSSTVAFADVPADHWANPFITALAQKDILTGMTDKSFRPDAPVTRAEFAAMLQKALDQPKIRQKQVFRDLPKNYWAISAIDQSFQMGFMNGYPNRVFRPNQKIPKFEALLAIATGLHLKNSANSAELLQAFQDSAELPQYTWDKIAAATEAGLVVNYPQPELLAPKQIMTRADAAALIYQVLVKQGKVQKVPSDYIVQPGS